MSNLTKWIEGEADGEPIIAIVIGARYYEGREDSLLYPVLSWKEARPVLDYEFKVKWGSTNCHAIWAWTESWVIFIKEYDGAASPGRLPRNPISGMPEMIE